MEVREMRALVALAILLSTVIACGGGASSPPIYASPAVTAAPATAAPAASPAGTYNPGDYGY